MLGSDAALTLRQKERLAVIRKLYDQQKTMYDSSTHSVSTRIMSLSQPWLRPVVRGKAKAAVEFGAKPDIMQPDKKTELHRQM